MPGIDHAEELQKLYVRQDRHDLFEVTIQTISDAEALLKELAELEIPELAQPDGTITYALQTTDNNNPKGPYLLMDNWLGNTKNKLELTWKQLNTNITNTLANNHEKNNAK